MQRRNPRAFTSKWYLPACLFWTVFGFSECGYFIEKALANTNDAFYWFAIPIWGFIGLTWGILARRAYRFRLHQNTD
jgi:hypothetical protein